MKLMAMAAKEKAPPTIRLYVRRDLWKVTVATAIGAMSMKRYPTL